MMLALLLFHNFSFCELGLEPPVQSQRRRSPAERRSRIPLGARRLGKAEVFGSKRSMCALSNRSQSKTNESLVCRPSKNGNWKMRN